MNLTEFEMEKTRNQYFENLVFDIIVSTTKGLCVVAKSRDRNWVTNVVLFPGPKGYDGNVVGWVIRYAWRTGYHKHGYDMT